MAAPDGIARNLIIKVAHGDEVNFVTRSLLHSTTPVVITQLSSGNKAIHVAH